jgi:hypothetical protein
MFAPSAVLITETDPTRRSSGACYPTRPGRECNAGTARRRVGMRWAGEEAEMTALIIALVIACLVFWRLALKILAITAVAVFVSGIVLAIEHLHHIIR